MVLILLCRFLMPAMAASLLFGAAGEQFVAVTTGLQRGSPVQKFATVLQEIHRSQTGQAVYVFALPKQR